MRGQSDVLRVDPEVEQYAAILHLPDYDFEVGKTCVLGVMVFGQELGATAFTVDSEQGSPGPGRSR